VYSASTSVSPPDCVDGVPVRSPSTAPAVDTSVDWYVDGFTAKNCPSAKLHIEINL